MNFRSRLTAVAISLLASPGLIAGTLLNQSTSTSGQFLVCGSDLSVRGAICELAESVKSDLLRLMDERDNWSAPIIVYEQSPQANLPEMPHAFLRLGQTGIGLRLQLELKMSADTTVLEIRRALLRATLVEMIHRRTPDLAAGKSFTEPPDWLVEGIEACADTSAIRSRVPSIPGTSVFSIEGILRMRPSALDGPSRSHFRACSVALVNQLAHLRDGRHRLSQFIFDLSTAADDGSAHFKQHFPEIFENASQVPLSPFPQSDQILTAERTDEILTALLSGGVQGALDKTYQLHELPAQISDPALRHNLMQLRSDLISLRLHANPIHEQVIREYERTTELLIRGKTKGISKRWGNLSAARKRIRVQENRINDYMNWFEATQAPSPSGLFGDYMKAAESAESLGERRRDPISVYLDVLESEFEK